MPSGTERLHMDKLIKQKMLKKEINDFISPSKNLFTPQIEEENPNLETLDQDHDDGVNVAKILKQINSSELLAPEDMQLSKRVYEV